MSGITCKILAADVAARLEGMAMRGDNLTGVFRDFQGHMQASIEANFAAGWRPDSWPGLKFSTKVAWILGRKSAFNKKGGMTAKGRAAWAGRLPLTDTGVLRRRATTGASVTITPRSFSYAVLAPQAAIMQFGGWAGRGHKSFIPARPYLVFQDEDIDYLERNLLAFITTGGFV